MKILIYILALSLVFTGCNKKWKKTSETSFSIELIKSKSSIPYLQVDSGMLNLTNFLFNGVRRKGNDVSFSDAAHDSTVFDIKSESILNPLEYDIPQGEYTSIDIDLRFDKNILGKSIIIKGMYKDSNELDAYFIFELKDRIDINIKATSANSNIITITSKEITTPVIKFDIIDWFEHIPQSAYDDGETINIGNDEYLYISKTSNTSLYTSILARIGQTATITFE